MVFKESLPHSLNMKSVTTTLLFLAAVISFAQDQITSFKNHFSALAIKAVPNDSNVAGTRGSVLVEKGLLNEGMSLLFSNMDFRFVNNATLSSAMYLMLAYALRRESKESDKYFRFVDENREKLEVDEKVLFERNRFRVQELTLSN